MSEDGREAGYPGGDDLPQDGSELVEFEVERQVRFPDLTPYVTIRIRGQERMVGVSPANALALAIQLGTESSAAASDAAFARMYLEHGFTFEEIIEALDELRLVRSGVLAPTRTGDWIAPA